nr:immunoglobulin heavy chain junction region [Macaca mulatta]MPN71172.1 immunoglobulin heavy chain junction region [Macaca mulatta]MPN71417.1 immunoglobulin heavy chain junction region [Macaca mulatta]MPN71764.1 immunoglobulin heavy chain junction region [Macaca mulatta]MPN73378.1 immunoglobulin heavy chain junction region [Macaca mulatta]
CARAHFNIWTGYVDYW